MIVKEYCLKYKGHRMDIDSRLKTTMQVFNFCKDIFDMDTSPIFESFYAIYVGPSCKVNGYMLIGQGSVKAVTVDQKLVMIGALESLSTGLFLVHNHPSGNVTPSLCDKQLTNSIKNACKSLDVELIDHIIVSGYFDMYYSFLEHGEL